MAQNNKINNASGSLTLDPGASGDSYIQYSINGTGLYRVGVDDDDGDAFKISVGSALGTADAFVMTAAGERTLPLQPAFNAYLSATVDNVTGDNTSYTCTYDVTVFDIQGDFSSTTTFTAPVSGIYNLAQLNMFLCNTTSSAQRYTLSTSNRLYLGTWNPGRSLVANFFGTNNWVSFNFGTLADMDAADTAITLLQAPGSSKTDDWVGTVSGVFSRFMGHLV